MALREREVTCTECGTKQTRHPTRSFFGFLKFTCDSCAKPFLYPLTPGFEGFYWLILGLGVVSALFILAKGQFPLPSIWLLLVSVALIKNRGVKQRVRIAEANSAHG